MSNFFANVATGCELCIDDLSRIGDKFREHEDMAMAGLAQAIVERLKPMAADPTNIAYDQISEDCGRSARGATSMVDRLHELNEDKMAELAETVSSRLSQFAYDAMAETQPISLKRED